MLKRQGRRGRGRSTPEASECLKVPHLKKGAMNLDTGAFRGTPETLQNLTFEAETQG